MVSTFAALPTLEVTTAGNINVIDAFGMGGVELDVLTTAFGHLTEDVFRDEEPGEGLAEAAAAALLDARV